MYTNNNTQASAVNQLCNTLEKFRTIGKTPGDLPAFVEAHSKIAGLAEAVAAGSALELLKDGFYVCNPDEAQIVYSVGKLYRNPSPESAVAILEELQSDAAKTLPANSVRRTLHAVNGRFGGLFRKLGVGLTVAVVPNAAVTESQLLKLDFSGSGSDADNQYVLLLAAGNIPLANQIGALLGIIGQLLLCVAKAKSVPDDFMRNIVSPELLERCPGGNECMLWCEAFAIAALQGSGWISPLPVSDAYADTLTEFFTRYIDKIAAR